MHLHAPPSASGLPCHPVGGHLDVEDAVVVDWLAMEAKSACTGQPPADGARAHGVGVGVGQRVPSLTHSDEPIPRHQHPHGLVVETHAPQVGSAGDPAEGRRLPLESHPPSVAVVDPRTCEELASDGVSTPIATCAERLVPGAPTSNGPGDASTVRRSARVRLLTDS